MHGCSDSTGHELGCNVSAGWCQLQVLIENGVDVNFADTDQRTALHVAASRGRAEVAFFLLNTPNVDINPLDRWATL